MAARMGEFFLGEDMFGIIGGLQQIRQDDLASAEQGLSAHEYGECSNLLERAVLSRFRCCLRSLKKTRSCEKVAARRSFRRALFLYSRLIHIPKNTSFTV